MQSPDIDQLFFDFAVGKMEGTGDSVARLIAARRLEARFQMSDDQFAGLIGTGTLRGRSAQVVWRTSAREFSFDATIDRWTSEIDAASGGIDIYARIGNVGIGTVLRPGAFVEVRVLGEKYSNVVRVPAQALHGTNTVYVIEDGRLAARKVERVASAGNDVLVRGGLRVDDTLVTTSFAEIGPGVRVEAK